MAICYTICIIIWTDVIIIIIIVTLLCKQMQSSNLSN